MLKTDGFEIKRTTQEGVVFYLKKWGVYGR
jgi:hypothetical protein